MIIIIDNKMGNIKSIENALNTLGLKNQISSDNVIIKKARGIIFPGVGSFPKAMENLKDHGLDNLLIDLIIKKSIPFLGICLGMQILFEKSYEKKLTKGLGLLKGKVVEIKKNNNFKVPHVGWNSFSIKKKNSLLNGIDKNSKFYFDHSFYVKSSSLNTFASLDYGQEMCVGIRSKNIFGVQFHPEKSQRNGLKMLKNFANYVEVQRDANN